uniref:Transposase n=1 Tax=Acrobeloides nanus TaxID=290746 RepID=A0A914DT44_9BILA
MLYTIEAWYPSQYVLQNSIERIKKFAAKLCANDFTASYPQLLEKLNWKPVNQLVMEKRALAMHHFTRGHRNLPDNAIALCRQEDRRRTGRTGHEWELVIPVISLEAVRSSSLNTARQTWNHLPEDIVEIPDPVRFKNAVKSPAVYDCLACKGIIRRTELAI